MSATTPEEYFGANPVGLDTFERVKTVLLAGYLDVTVQVSKSQVAFRRRRGFAYLWVPGHYLRRPAAPVVLSIASANRLTSERFKEVVHPGPWMHHLEIAGVDEVDDEVAPGRGRGRRCPYTLKRNENRVFRLPSIIVENSRKRASDLGKRRPRVVGSRWSETGSA